MNHFDHFDQMIKKMTKFWKVIFINSIIFGYWDKFQVKFGLFLIICLRQFCSEKKIISDFILWDFRFAHFSDPFINLTPKSLEAILFIQYTRCYCDKTFFDASIERFSKLETKFDLKLLMVIWTRDTVNKGKS